MRPIVNPKVVVLPSFYPMEHHYMRGNFFEEQTRLLLQRGSDIAVVFNENRSLASFSLKKLRHIHFQKRFKVENNIPVLRRMSWNIIPTRYDLGKKIWINDAINLVHLYMKKYGRPDLFHVHCAFDAGSVAVHFKDKVGIPYIITEHSSFFLLADVSEEQRKRVVDIYNKAARVIVVSESFRKSLAAKLDFDKNRIEVIPNFIDTDYFNRKADTNLQDIQGERILFTVCHHTYNKRLDRLLQAFQLITVAFPQWKLVIGGAGVETDRLKSLTGQLSLQQKVVFTGPLNKEQVRQYMNDADLFVLSSDVETFGVVLIEAMAMGLPIVATQCGGPSDIITEETGLLSERNVESLANKLTQAMSNYGAYSKERIRAYAVQHFGGKAVTGKYMDIYVQSIQREVNY